MKNQFQIPVSFYQEGDLVVATSPAFEISTQGETFDIARKNFEELIDIFLEENNTKDSLEKVLLECGWSKDEKQMIPPREIARVYQDITIPSFAY